MTTNLNYHDVIILGSGPAGHTAALYTARAGLDTLIIGGDTPGGALMNKALPIPDYPGFPGGVGGQELAERLRRQAEAEGAAHADDYIIALDSKVQPFRLRGLNGTEYAAACVVIATGTVPQTLDVEGEYEFAHKGVSYSAAADGPRYAGAAVAVAGDGDHAAEAALYLAGLGCRITVLPPGDSLRVTMEMEAQLRAQAEISLRRHCRMTAIKGSETGGVHAVMFRYGENAAEEMLPVSAVFIAIGRCPASYFLPPEIMRDKAGYVMTDAQGQTGVPGIYAAGDVSDPDGHGIIRAAAQAATVGLAVTERLRHLQRPRQDSGIANSAKVIPLATRRRKAVRHALSLLETT